MLKYFFSLKIRKKLINLRYIHKFLIENCHYLFNNFPQKIQLSNIF